MPLNIIKKKTHTTPIKYFLSKIRRKWPELYQNFTFTCQDRDDIRNRGIYEKKNQEDISSVQFSSVAHSCPTLATPWIAALQASPSNINSWSSLKIKCIGLEMPSSNLILCRPLLLLPPVPPSIRVFSNESTLSVRWPKHWSFSLSISPSNEHPGLVSFRMDLLDLLAVP